MHSRIFLHRAPSEPPRASVTPSASDYQLPLGFADVRSDAPVDGDARPRGPLGFAPSEPRFVTELSFRRTPRPRPTTVAAASAQPGGTAGLPLGHASGWRPADLSADPEHVSPGGSSGDAPAPEGPRAEQQTPFYKRELTFRRRRPDHDLEAPAPAELSSDPERKTQVEDAPGHTDGGDGDVRVPFYKREISLRRRRPEPLEAVAPPDPDEDDELVDSESSRPFGFAAPLEEEPTDEQVAEEVPDETPFAGSDPAPEADDAEPAVDPEPATEPELELPVATSDAVDEPVADADAHADEPDTVTDPAADEPEPPLASEAEPEPDLEAEPVHHAVLEPLDGEDDPYDAPAWESSSISDDPADDLDPSDHDDRTVSGAGRRPRRGRGARPARQRVAAPKGGRGGRRVVGLKIGASQLAAAVVARHDGRDQLVQLARTPLEAGIVSDGEVRDPDALQAAVRAFFDEHHLPRRDIRIGVSSNRIGVRTVDLSGIDDAERFDNAVRFKAHEVLPVSFSESVLDYRVVEERVAENGDVTKRVLLVVAPKDQVEPFAAACTGAGLRLAGIDLEALGLLRTFVAPQAPGTRLATDTATVVVAMGHESTTLLVAGGGLCEFTRVFDWGGLALQQSIAQELDVQLPGAATILHGLALSGPGHTSLDEEMRNRAVDAVRTRLTPFARELVSSLQFYQSQQGSLGIGEILITGGASHLEGLADALHQMIGVSVRVGDPLQRLSVTTPVDPALERIIGSFAVPVGLAIEDGESRGVNLVPDELRRQRRKKPSALQVALPLAAVVPLAAMGFLFTKANSDASSQRSSLGQVQAQIDALPEPTRPDIDPTLASVQQQRAAALAQVLGGRLAWDRVLGDLSRVLPANVWLTQMTAQVPQVAVAGPLPAAATPSSGAPAPAPTGVTIEGYTYSVPDVARLLGRLGTLPSLTNVSLASTQQKDVGKRNVVSFTILADIRSNGGAQ